MHVRLILAALALSLSLPVLATQPNIEPGQWEYTNVTRYEGVPMPERTDTNRECVTAEDIQQGDAFVEESDECEVSNMEMGSSEARYSMVCVQEGVEMNMDAHMRFMGERMEGTIRASLETPMGPMEMHMDVTGRRIGDC
jgi:hypothetical protein